MVIFILSQIWKFGGVIERDKKDGQLVLKNHEKIPQDVLKTADAIFDDIDKYLKSVEGMNAIDLTTWKMTVALCGWQKNETINDFLNNDETALNLFMDYQTKLVANGWKELYDDWRQFEDDKTQLLKQQIFERAKAFAKGGK